MRSAPLSRVQANGMARRDTAAYRTFRASAPRLSPSTDAGSVPDQPVGALWSPARSVCVKLTVGRQAVESGHPAAGIVVAETISDTVKSTVPRLTYRHLSILKRWIGAGGRRCAGGGCFSLTSPKRTDNTLRDRSQASRLQVRPSGVGTSARPFTRRTDKLLNLVTSAED